MQIEIDDFVTRVKKVADLYYEGAINLSESNLKSLHTCLNYIIDNCNNYPCSCKDGLIKQLKVIRLHIKGRLNEDLSPPDFVKQSRKTMVEEFNEIYFSFVERELST